MPRESSRPGQEGKEHGPLWTTQIHRPRIGPAGQIRWSLFQFFQCGEKKMKKRNTQGQNVWLETEETALMPSPLDARDPKTRRAAI